MPKNNYDVRHFAGECGARVVTGFNQGKGVCDGLVSWWLRKMAKRQGLIDRTRFTMARGVHRQYGPVEVYRVNWGEPGVQPDPGCAKAQRVHDTVYNDEFEEFEYIEKGSSKSKPLLERQDYPEGRDVDADLENHLRRAVVAEQALAKIGIRFIGGGGHALGVNASEPGGAFIYFDPNIGEFTFPSFDTFWAWWKRCKDEGWGDFASLGHRYTLTSFKKRAALPLPPPPSFAPPRPPPAATATAAAAAAAAGPWGGP